MHQSRPLRASTTAAATRCRLSRVRTLRGVWNAGWRGLLLATTAVGLLYACSDERPGAASTGTGGGQPGTTQPVLAPGDAGRVDDASAARCSACAAKACSSALMGCTNDAVCAGCYDGSTAACFVNAAFGAVFDCTCASCAADCDLTCADVGCARCAAAQCRSELDACLASATCKPCISDGAPSSCANDPLALALYTCTSSRCRTSGCN